MGQLPRFLVILLVFAVVPFVVGVLVGCVAYAWLKARRGGEARGRRPAWFTVLLAATLGALIALVVVGGIAFQQLSERAASLRRRAAALGDLKAGLTHVRREQWEQAVARLAGAAEGGAVQSDYLPALYAAQARSLWHLGRFDEALEAARRHRAAQETLGKADDPFSCALLAQALSLCYARTGDARQRDEALEWLDRFVTLAEEAGKSKDEVTVLAQPTVHRLENRSTILDADYLLKAYPSPAMCYAHIPTGEGRYLHCGIVRDERWAAIRLIALDSERVGTRDDELDALSFYAEGALDAPLLTLSSPSSLRPHERRYIEVPQAESIEHPVVLAVASRRDGGTSLEAFVIYGDKPLALPTVARTLLGPASPEALRQAMREAVHAKPAQIEQWLARKRRSGG